MVNNSVENNFNNRSDKLLSQTLLNFIHFMKKLLSYLLIVLIVYSIISGYIKDFLKDILFKTVDYLFSSYLNILLLFLLVIIAFLYYFLLEFRYSFKAFPFYLITKVQGKNFEVIKTIEGIRSVLKLTDKGVGLEDLIACEAWSPIISIESVNGEIWETIRKNFHILLAYIPGGEKSGLAEDTNIGLNLLKTITNEERENLTTLILNGKIIESRDISILVLKVFLKFLFGEFTIKTKKKNSKLDLHESLDEIEKNFDYINAYLKDVNFLDTMYLATLEYRKEIACKGKGNTILKHKAVELIVKIIKSSKLQNVFVNWNDPLCYSTIMQPFIISPTINFSDIFVSIKKYRNFLNELSKESKEIDSDDFCDSIKKTYISYCILKDHPFPILERFNKEKNTQYFLLMDEVEEILNKAASNENNSSSKIENINYLSQFNFGYGIRLCLGKAFGMTVLSSLMTKELLLNEKFDPRINHMYSGRDNDNGNLFESIYQMKVFFCIIFKLLKNRIFESKNK